jgi:preprotein translocase SecE subunit
MIKKIESVWSEIRAIVWPSRQRVYTDTLIVVVSLVVAGALIALVDYGLAQILQKSISSVLY